MRDQDDRAWLHVGETGTVTLINSRALSLVSLQRLQDTRGSEGLEWARLWDKVGKLE